MKKFLIEKTDEPTHMALQWTERTKIKALEFFEFCDATTLEERQDLILELKTIDVGMWLVYGAYRYDWSKGHIIDDCGEWISDEEKRERFEECLVND